MVDALLQCCHAIHAALPHGELSAEGKVVYRESDDGLCRPAPGPITSFHSARDPGVDLSQYAHRIAYYTRYGADGIRCGIALTMRYVRRRFFRGCPVTSLEIHRLFLVAVQVGMKAISDIFLSNARYAQVCALPTTEVNRLEVELLLFLDFDAMPKRWEMYEQPAAIVQRFAAAASRLTVVLENKTDDRATASGAITPCRAVAFAEVLGTTVGSGDPANVNVLVVGANDHRRG